ncbi:MAG: ABC transporter ATP-binding protein [Planctomycetaceae bacterium]|nr:ABC transporter ATP-binding protein [Planctomycetaceae bacterium]MCB9951297.1 ABC transporter ATP-binding protein [Planctomycetaceae bacterium]
MIELRNVSISAGEFCLSKVSFKVPQGSYAILMGRSGTGKTTILESICGLRQISGGQILLDDLEIQDLTPGERNVGYVPQDLGLFPTMTVQENMEFPLFLRSVSKTQRQERVNELAGLLEIEHLLGRGVKHLSGGEAQRVALGRALSFRPQVLLLDEPLSALDESTRTAMQELLSTLKEATGTTTLHVTHSSDEARALADVTFHLRDGKIVRDAEATSTEEV